MLLAQRESHINFVLSALSQRNNLVYNKSSIIKIIDILIKENEFPRQNKILVQIKSELMRKELNFKNIERMSNELRAVDE